MTQDTTLWKCECEHIEYGEYPPEECDKCYRANDFVQISEEEINAMGKEGNTDVVEDLV